MRAQRYLTALGLLAVISLIVLGAQLPKGITRDTPGVYSTSSYVVTTNAASNYSGAELEIPTTLKGIWLDGIENRSANSTMECRIDAATIRTTAVVTVTNQFDAGLGTAPLVVFRAVRTTTATADNGTHRQSKTVFRHLLPALWIPGGNFLSCWISVVNATANISYTWREIRP